MTIIRQLPRDMSALCGKADDVESPRLLSAWCCGATDTDAAREIDTQSESKSSDINSMVKSEGTRRAALAKSSNTSRYPPIVFSPVDESKLTMAKQRSIADRSFAESTFALELGAEIVRSASEVLFGPCQQEMQILRDIEFDENTEASSLYTDDTDDAEDMTLTDFVRMRRSFGRSTSSAARKQQVVEPVLEEEEAEIPETSVSEEAEKYANALAALQQKQAEALEEHHRLKEEERFVSAAPASIFPRKPSVAEQVLLEADEEEFSVDMPSDESESKNDSLASEKGPNQNDGFPEPMVVQKIHPQGSTDAQDMSVTDVLPSDFVPFWTEDSSTSTPSTTPEEYASACLKILDNKKENKSQRTKKLSKIVPSFLRKRSMMGKKKN